MRSPTVIMHVLFRFSIGGLENGIVNLINGLDEGKYHHCIVCLSDYDKDFVRRLHTSNFEIHALHKRAGNDLRVWWRMWKLLGRVRPNILHTRNFAALELQLLGWLRGVGWRIHGEHGWDVHDMAGNVQKYQLARRVFGHLVHRFVALSRDIELYLVKRVGIAPTRVTRIPNGVDSELFAPQIKSARQWTVIGTVGRMKTVKNQTLLCRAFVNFLTHRRDLRGRVRLLLVGSGPLQEQCEAIVTEGLVANEVEFRGDSSDVAGDLQEMDVFVLPSLAEGISNTILEAMACSVPVIAAAVGGNGELVIDGETGCLIRSNDIPMLVAALARYIEDPELCARHGARGRKEVEQHFSLTQMLQAYDALYQAGMQRPAWVERVTSGAR